MEGVGQVFQRMAANDVPGATLIVCLFTGPSLPSNCAPMPRQPKPEVGMPFDSTFPSIFARAYEENPAIHDGAVMVGRTGASEVYRIVGWSFRLFPEAAPVEPQANRGSAFNSAHAMSQVPTVDAVYLLSRTDIFLFRNGAAVQVSR
jgi:hypothetical protein